MTSVPQYQVVSTEHSMKTDDNLTASTGCDSVDGSRSSSPMRGYNSDSDLLSTASGSDPDTPSASESTCSDTVPVDVDARDDESVEGTLHISSLCGSQFPAGRMVYMLDDPFEPPSQNEWTSDDMAGFWWMPWCPQPEAGFVSCQSSANSSLWQDAANPFCTPASVTDGIGFQQWPPMGSSIEEGMIASQPAGNNALSQANANPCAKKAILSRIRKLLDEFKFDAQPKGLSIAKREAKKEEMLSTVVSMLSSEPAGNVARMLEGCVWEMAKRRDGCWFVQAALALFNLEERAPLIMELRGNVLEAIEHPHAHHVIEKLIKVSRSEPEELQFIIDEVRGFEWCAAPLKAELGGAEWCVQHRFGCRVFQRLLEVCRPKQFLGMVEEIIWGPQNLCLHAFGKYMVGHIFEYGIPEQKYVLAWRVLQLDEKQLLSLAKTRHGDAAVITSFDTVTWAEGDKAWKFLKVEENLTDLKKTRFGKKVAEYVESFRTRASATSQCGCS